MLFPVTSGFVFQQVDLSAVLEDKIQIPEFFLIVVTKNQVFGSNGLRKDIFQETACIDADFSLQQRDLKVPRLASQSDPVSHRNSLEKLRFPFRVSGVTGADTLKRGRATPASRSHRKLFSYHCIRAPSFNLDRTNRLILLSSCAGMLSKIARILFFSVLLAYLAISDL